MFFIHEFAAAFFQVCLLFHCQFVKLIVPRHVFRCFTGKVSRDSFQTAGRLWDLCKIARLPDVSLTDVQDPLGMKDGNYYSCDWCRLWPESNKRFALAGSIQPERLWTRQGWQPISAHKKCDRLRQTRCRMRPAKQFLVLCLATYFVTLKLHAGLFGAWKGAWTRQGGDGDRKTSQGLFFPALQGGSDDLGILLSTWVYVMTRESKRSNPSNMDADVSTRGPAATFDVFARVSAYFFTWIRCSLFPRLFGFHVQFFNSIVSRNVLRCVAGLFFWYSQTLQVSKLWGACETLARSPRCLMHRSHGHVISGILAGRIPGFRVVLLLLHLPSGMALWFCCSSLCFCCHTISR